MDLGNDFSAKRLCKLLSAQPKHFGPSEKAKRSLKLPPLPPRPSVTLKHLKYIDLEGGGEATKKLHVPPSGVSLYNVQCICVTKIPLFAN